MHLIQLEARTHSPCREEADKQLMIFLVEWNEIERNAMEWNTSLAPLLLSPNESATSGTNDAVVNQTNGMQWRYGRDGWMGLEEAVTGVVTVCHIIYK